MLTPKQTRLQTKIRRLTKYTTWVNYLLADIKDGCDHVATQRSYSAYCAICGDYLGHWEDWNGGKTV